ncbi:ABC-F family ATP-binding cassette domain-containing protein [Sporichthya polymorpha]|uniref:ABC-F family ATP-binding cassette domain-containing protein n=1 Tax=Sporichthya polymorpha TaxID=35751 RepID=UPI00036E9AFA|nr:ATP-binding cassette domain-containing protein [Sporichthya polymorpha]
MGHVDVSRLQHRLPDGRLLLDEVSFRVGDGAKVALVGANGSGKTTLMNLIAGDLDPQAGTVTRSGGLGVMRQFIGHRDSSENGTENSSQATVRDLLVSVSSPRVRTAAGELDAAELLMMERDDERTQLRYAQALADWADAGGYEAEVLWDVCTQAALGTPYERAQWRDLVSLSGGEQKRLALEALLRGPDEVLLLDEPDNYLDVPGKRWLEEQLAATGKTVLFVSHDRELLARTANRIVTVEGGSAWVHGGGFDSYHQARLDRHSRLDELRRRWDEQRERLRQQMLFYKNKAAYNSDMASRYQAAIKRLERFDAAGPPEERPREQNVTMRLRGGRTGVRAVTCERLELTGLMKPFDVEFCYGERIAVLGSNGSGKSHFLRLLGALPDGDGGVAHTGVARLGARVVPGHFSQTSDHPEFAARTLVEILAGHALPRGEAMGALRRYELHQAGDQLFRTLSGGQKARFQILLLELAGATLLLLDEPTDNLDVDSAEALEEGLASYSGTVVSVTHDRWFARSFDRFLVFGSDGVVYESAEPVWDETRVVRPR